MSLHAHRPEGRSRVPRSHAPRSRRLLATLALSGALVAVPLSGCSLSTDDPAFSDAIDAVNGAISQGLSAAGSALNDASSALADLDLGSFSASNTTKLVIRDAASDAEIATITDEAAITKALSGFGTLSGWGVSTTHPAQSLAEYRIEFWERATVKFGEDPEKVGEVSFGSVITYKDSSLLTFETRGGLISINLEAPASAADGLRSLADTRATK